MKRNFTLAEILITLGIIGVVAALTIPVLINKINFIVFKSQLKQEYSQALSTIKLMQDDNETEYQCYYTDTSSKHSECDAFWRTFFKYRKLSHICEKDDYSCKPQYTRSNITANGGQASSCTLFANAVPGYVLTNGVIYYPWTSHIANGRFPQIFTVDINGMKGPNKYGYDVFYVNFYKAKQGVIFSNNPCTSPIEKGGKSFKNMLK